MKLSTAPKHLAPRMKVRDLSGKLHTRIFYTNSNAPGRRSYRTRRNARRQETLISGRQKMAELGEQKATIKKQISYIERLFAVFSRKGGK